MDGSGDCGAGRRTVADLAGVTAVDLCGLQLPCSAHRAFAARGGAIGLRRQPGWFRQAAAAAACGGSEERSAMTDRHAEAYRQEADRLLVEAGGARFVAPLSNVSGCMELARGGAQAGRQPPLSVRGELAPYIPLRERFAIPGEPPPIEQVIAAETPGGQYGFLVDRVIGDHHTVIEKLGRLFRETDPWPRFRTFERLAAAAIREAGCRQAPRSPTV